MLGGSKLPWAQSRRVDPRARDRSFTVTSEGNNSTQCVGSLGVGSTGNALDQIGVTQVYGYADDFEFDEVDSSIEVSPENSTECDQQVNQAASAFG